MDESVELLLLLPEGSLVGVEARLEPALALIFFLLVRGLLVPTVIVQWWCCHETCPFHRLIGIEAEPSQAMARVVLEQIKDICWLAVDDDHEC